MTTPFDPEAFRRALHRAADVVADYLETVGDRPVLPNVEPGDLLSQLPAEAPEDAESFDALIDDFQRLVVPGVTHWNHPGFLAYFSSNGSEPGILGELLAAGLSVNAMLWHTSPAATELEIRACDWLRRLLGLPDAFQGHVNDTASVSTFLALAAARDTATDRDIRHEGLSGGPHLVVYCSDQTHSSIDKAVVALGLGLHQLRKIETDDEFRMRPDRLLAALTDDRAAGRLPIAVVASVGTTSTTSVDPVAEIADLCDREKVWLHVDAAWAGSAAVCPEERSLFAGWERGDSIVVNPHKWMATPMDCSVLFVRDPDLLRAAFSLVPEYLETREDAHPAKIDLMDLGVQLGRRFRALKLWFVMRAFGAAGLREKIRRHLRWGRRLAQRVDDHPDFELAAPAPWSVVCLRALLPDEPPAREDEFNRRVLEAVNRRGDVFLSHTKLQQRYVIRVAVSNLRTEEDRVDLAWQQIREEAERLRTDSDWNRPNEGS
ncbi:MAG: pyridoxal-dependent decarboxylase [Thermoanaerobaculia bacterium]|nr:pyridoxal-dependent decarboxylase [Thermoanaerobaculia bacterium]